MKQEVLCFSPDDFLPVDLSVLLPADMQDEYWITEAAEVTSDFHQVVQPKLVYRIFTDWESTSDTLLLEGKALHGGRRMLALLEKADTLAVLIATLGEEVMQLYKRYDKDGDLIKAYLCDTLVNNRLDQMMKIWRKSLAKTESCGSTFPLSPGCCDWDITEQAQLFSLLQPDVIGVSLSESSMMYPLKSLSALVGFGERLPFMEEECLYCGRKNCNYRRRK